MKKIMVTGKGKRALALSIAHWAVVQGLFKEFVEANAFANSCPLCAVYNGDYENDCKGCPIKLDGSECGLSHSPWKGFTTGAEKMCDYLIELDKRTCVK